MGNVKKIKKPNMVNVLILNENGHALLINNIKHRANRWEFPGGKLEKSFEKKQFSLECMAIKEAKQELGIDIEFSKTYGLHILGDYETQTPEGNFLCRTFHAKITHGKPQVMEPKIHRSFDYFSYEGLLKLKEQGILVPNLVTALPELRKYVR